MSVQQGGGHTPGPWVWRGTPGSSDLCSAHGDVLKDYGYEGFGFASYDDAQDLANANLFAAAPILLEGAEDAVDAFKLLRIGMQDEPKAVELIDAILNELEYAIRRAKGESAK